ncbi:MAG: hypothetical protein COT71_02820 [Candidatus Andersenbacteria bacterium CG10_big_fil_rev_8_21_14_0_10_54_11]|uniref:M23ase beta-sheet core domain-containing protein n=1 Tax=Candidatus Andersenbacteria bacterium CG10_big_fil_rev_8_21_14_0_10_54_11 TaxID=1974485 RepID=A0A2M6WZ46_9BACT|nr:MAG: hypothetical protein COT71_02820 [Candidatus Andersenbacteria bacterium CG10_big_fil_rev_8_21_14_0_10_54_11]
MTLRLRRLALLVHTVFLLALALPTTAQSLDKLQEELSSKRDALKAAEARIEKFRNDVQLKRREAKTLEDQIEIIDDTIQELELSIAGTVAEIDETNAAIAAVEKEISQREEEISQQKALLAEYLRSLYTVDRQSNVTILLKYDSFSEAVQEAATFEELQNRSRDTLQHIKTLKAELEHRQNDLSSYRSTLVALRHRQEEQQTTLTTNKESKANILSLTRQQETQFQKLLGEAQAAHKAAEAEISRLDTVIREELRKQGRAGLPSVGAMSWPIEPIFGIACGFHCAGYPYAYLIGPHSGIDVPTYVGTPIKAPADGYVARTHDSGGSGYSYILLLHGEEVSTVYGHVSGFAVSEGQMVTRGTVIGYTGGAPGTHGAGLSTGAHLHFEVRVHNAPTDPMQYL